MNNPNGEIRLELKLSKTTLRRSLAFAAVLAVAVPGYVVASHGFSLAGASQDGDANNDGNIDEGEAKNALYGLATELNAVKGSLGGGTKAVLVNSTPTGADCDAAIRLNDQKTANHVAEQDEREEPCIAKAVAAYEFVRFEILRHG